MSKPSDLVQGTLDLLILTTVAAAPTHGWDTGREAKVYTLTAAGRRQLSKELESWDRLSSAIQLVVREA